MKYLGKITHDKDLVTKEYVDNALTQGVTFYKKLESTYVTSDVPVSTIPIGISNFTTADMLFVDINGLNLIKDVDFTLSGTNIVLTTPIEYEGQNVHIVVLRAVNVNTSDYSMLKGDPGDVSDVLVDGVSVVSNGIARITIPQPPQPSQLYDFEASFTQSIDARGVYGASCKIVPKNMADLTPANKSKISAYLVNGATVYPLEVNYAYTNTSNGWCIISFKSHYGNPQSTTSSSISGTLHVVSPFEIDSVGTWM